MIKGTILKAMREAPLQILEGLVDVIKAPPEKMVKIWESIPEEDQELFKKAAISGARLAARAIIAADTGAKKEF